jgi:hypothetical protein
MINVSDFLLKVIFMAALYYIVVTSVYKYGVFVGIAMNEEKYDRIGRNLKRVGNIIKLKTGDDNADSSKESSE